MSEDRIEEIEAAIADLEKRWPAHSASPAMLQQLDELEEELNSLKKELEAVQEDA